MEKFLYTRWKVSVPHFPNLQTFARKHSIINVLRSAFQNRPRIPIVFFRDGLDLVEKALLFSGLLFFFWFVYLLFCITFHRLSMRNEHNKFGYLAKDDLEKGKEVGTHLEGW